MTVDLTAAPKATVYSDHGYLLEKYGPLMRTADVADVLKCHQSHVRAMCQDGELPAIQIGKRWFVPTAKMAALWEADADGC